MVTIVSNKDTFVIYLLKKWHLLSQDSNLSSDSISSPNDHFI